MKRHACLTGTTLICLCAFMSCLGCATAERSDWRVLQDDSYGNKFSYDSESVKHTSAGTVTAWAASSGARYHYEIDCKNKKARILEGAGAEQKWFDVVSGSGDELLYNAVCK